MSQVPHGAVVLAILALSALSASAIATLHKLLHHRPRPAHQYKTSHSARPAPPATRTPALYSAAHAFCSGSATCTAATGAAARPLVLVAVIVARSGGTSTTLVAR